MVFVHHADRDLERHRENRPITVGLETAGGHHGPGFEHGPRNVEACPPMASFGPDAGPLVLLQVLEVHELCTMVTAEPIHSFFSDHFRRLGRSAPVADSDRVGSHLPELHDHAGQRIVMRGPGKGVRGVEVGLEQDVFPLDRIDLEQVDRSRNA